MSEASPSVTPADEPGSTVPTSQDVGQDAPSRTVASWAPGQARGDGKVAYRSPNTGQPLVLDTAHSLSAPGERWPVIDAIPYLRVGSEDLAARALHHLDHGRPDEAAAHLLAENDPWWDEAPPPHEQLLGVVRRRRTLTLREAMAGLGWGRVGDYFAYRWSDPTYLAGLTILDRHWCRPESAFEVACGIGHYLRALSRAGVARVAGGDVVWGKLWVARYWVCPEAELVCFDAEAARWPIAVTADLVTCHDAFYFLRDKEAAARRIREGARELYAVPHVHDADAETYSSGAAVTRDALEGVFPGAVTYDDAELTRAGAAGDAPAPLRPRARVDEALSVVGGPALAEPRLPSSLLRPADGTPLVRNPLLTPDGIAWPSDRYRDEYGPLATYGRAGRVPERAAMSEGVAPLVRTRDLLDLPERW